MRKELHLSCQRRKTLVEVAGSRDGSRWSKVSSQIEGIVTNREKWKQNREERKLESVYLRWLLVVTTFSGDTKTIATPIDCGDNCGGNLSCLFFFYHQRRYQSPILVSPLLVYAKWNPTYWIRLLIGQMGFTKKGSRGFGPQVITGDLLPLTWTFGND